MGKAVQSYPLLPKQWLVHSAGSTKPLKGSPQGTFVPSVEVCLNPCNGSPHVCTGCFAGAHSRASVYGLVAHSGVQDPAEQGYTTHIPPHPSSTWLLPCPPETAPLPCILTPHGNISSSCWLLLVFHPPPAGLPPDWCKPCTSVPFSPVNVNIACLRHPVP